MAPLLTNYRPRMALVARAFGLFFILGFVFGRMLTYVATLTGVNFIAVALLLFLVPAATTHSLFKWVERASHDPRARQTGHVRFR